MNAAVTVEVPVETLTALLDAWSELTADLDRDAVPAAGDAAWDRLIEVVDAAEIAP